MAFLASESAIQFSEVSGGKLAWRSDGEGPPILLCQRFRGTMDDWDPVFIEALIRTGRRVIRFDNLGIGRSEGETPASIPAWADTALAFMTAIGLDEVDVLGWSIGGMVAQWMALKAPDRIPRLIVAGSGPGAITEVPPDPKVAEIRTHETNSEEDFLYLFFAHSHVGLAAGRASIARIAAQSNGPAVRAASYQAQILASKAYNSGPNAVRPRLAELKMPILVANGVADVMQPAFASFVIAQGAPNAKLILYPNAGHAFLFEYPSDFAEEVDRFLGARLNKRDDTTTTVQRSRVSNDRRLG